MLPRLLPLAAAAALITAAPATATTFKIVKATHTSSSTKTDVNYRGTSTASWSRARAGRIQISRVGSAFTGLGEVHVRGTYGIDVTTDREHCAFTAPTGSPDHGLVAPGDFSLTFGPDPRTGKGLL